MENTRYPFYNLPLPYGYDALEPYIDEKTMELHHNRHLQTYIDQLNAVLKKEPRLQRLSLQQLIRSAGRLPQQLQTQVRNNAGGVYNHRFFFTGLSNAGSSRPDGRLGRLLARDFGDFDDFQAAFEKAALSVFGSGYAWLVYDGRRLKIMTTPNQNCPLEQGNCPVLAIDVWEHAYYLKHYNVRAAYIADWMKIINWEQAEENLLCCQTE